MYLNLKPMSYYWATRLLKYVFKYIWPQKNGLFRKELLFLIFHNIVTFLLKQNHSLCHINILIYGLRKNSIYSCLVFLCCFTSLLSVFPQATGQIIRGQICLGLGLYNNTCILTLGYLLMVMWKSFAESNVGAMNWISRVHIQNLGCFL